MPHVDQARVAKLCIANTHLLFNPRRGDVKLAQLMTLFAEIDKLTDQSCPAGPQHRNRCPVLICGDMNMEPFSQLYKFVRRGKLALDGQPAAKLSGQERNWNWGHRHPLNPDFLKQHTGLTDQSQYVNVCQQRFNRVASQTDATVLGDVYCKQTESSDTEPVPSTNSCSADKQTIFTQGSGIVSHSFGLDSVYKHVIKHDDDGEHLRHRKYREVTTFHTHANCTVDYIFYTPSVSGVNHSENGFRPKKSATQTTRGCESSSDKREDKLSSFCVAPLLASNTESLSSVPQQSSVINTACEISDYRLTLLARLQLLSNKDVKLIGRLPNKFISSDHLILAAQFLLTSGSSG